MPNHFHAVVWIDHSQARVFHIGLTGEDEVTLHPHLEAKHLHHKTQVTSALADAGEILIIGPADAKTELAKYLREKHHAIGERIVAVEAADHPSDREIVAYAKKHFKMAPARITTRD